MRASDCVSVLSSPMKTPAQPAVQPLLQLATRRGQLEQPLPPVAGAARARDQAALDQLAEQARQALLAQMDPADQLDHGDARMAPDEVEHPTVIAAEALLGELAVRPSDQGPVGGIQQLDPPRELLVAQEQRVGGGARQASGGLLDHVDSHGRSMLRAVL